MPKRGAICLEIVDCRSVFLPVEVDLGVIEVLRLARVASGESTEEGVGQKTSYLLLGHSQGMVFLCFK